MPLAELPDLADRALRLARKLDGGIRAVKLGQQWKLIPPSVDEPAVPSARTAAADVLLEDHDACVRHPLEELVGGPHPGVAAADDRHVAFGRAEEGSCGRRFALSAQRLAQPPAASSTGFGEHRMVHGIPKALLQFRDPIGPADGRSRLRA